MSKGLWYTEEFGQKLRVGFKVERSLFSGKSDYQLIEVFETSMLGKTLAIDGLLMTSVRDEVHYHELLVQPPMCTAPEISRVLIIGGGDGGSVREVLKHPAVQQCVLVEIDALVVEVSKKYLPEIGRAWDDKRLEVKIDDGIEFVRNAPAASFDVVLLDGSDPVGPAEGLFNESFYRDVARVLKPTGVFALQSESPLLFEDVFYDIQALLREVFGTAHPYFGAVPLYGTGMWSWTFASQQTHPLALVEERVAYIETSSEVYNRDVHRGAFAVPQAIKRKLDNLPKAELR